MENCKQERLGEERKRLDLCPPPIESPSFPFGRQWGRLGPGLVEWVKPLQASPANSHYYDDFDSTACRSGPRHNLAPLRARQGEGELV